MDSEEFVVVPKTAILAALYVLVHATRHDPSRFHLTRRFMSVVADIYGVRPSDLQRALSGIRSSQHCLFEFSISAGTKTQKRCRKKKGEGAQQLSLL